MSFLVEALNRITRREDLTRPDAAEVLREIMNGETNPAMTGALLAALRTKGETIEEISGFAQTMRALATRIETTRRPLVDTCGTGGDGAHTFNISTTAAFVVAGAGLAVAKHGNRAASSPCGSADVLEHLGVHIEASPRRVGECIDEIGIGFLFARTLHTAMKHVAPVRAELKIRTVFNLLGPLTNPARADAQVIGVYDRALCEPIAHVLMNLGVERAFVVAGCDGLDEITLGGPTFVAEAHEGDVQTYEVSPELFGVDPAPKEALRGGDAEANAIILRKVLEGHRGPHRDVVQMNAAAALVAGGVAQDLRDGFERAAHAIDSGAALDKLTQLAELSHLEPGQTVEKWA
jgi:anthranilate phosphoribosyltransferase